MKHEAVMVRRTVYLFETLLSKVGWGVRDLAQGF